MKEMCSRKISFEILKTRYKFHLHFSFLSRQDEGQKNCHEIALMTFLRKRCTTVVFLVSLKSKQRRGCFTKIEFRSRVNSVVHMAAFLT